MKRFYLLLLLVLILSSCGKNFLMLDDHYARANRKERMFLKSYHKTDSICIPRIKFRHEANIGRGTNGRVSIRREDVGNSIIQSFSRSFSMSFCDGNKESPLIQENEFSKSSPDNNGNSCCKKIIVPDLIITSYTSSNIEGGGGLTFVEDMGNDVHRFDYKLVTSIYQNDTLVYMDNRAYWTQVFTERDERLRYQVPQVVLDSLVSLTLQEYFKRVK